MKGLILILSVMISQQVAAQSCQETVNNAVKKCNEAFADAQTKADDNDARLMEMASAGMQGGGADMASSAATAIPFWDDVVDVCTQLRRRCADVCIPESQRATTAAAKTAVTDMKLDCLSETNTNINRAEGRKNALSRIQYQAALSGNSASEDGVVIDAGDYRPDQEQGDEPVEILEASATQLISVPAPNQPNGIKVMGVDNKPGFDNIRGSLNNVGGAIMLPYVPPTK